MSPTHFSSLIIRPSPYAKELVEKLRSEAEVKRILPRRRLNMTIRNIQYCYLILEGRVAFHRESDDRMLGTASAPTLLGISNLPGGQIPGYIKMLTPCEIGIITTERAHEIIKENNLWETLSRHMLVISSKLYATNALLTAPSTYQLICAQLLELMSEDESIRLTMTAESYIRDKTHLSRSGVMRVLSKLKAGGHIEINRGILTNIHDLPDEY